MNYRNLQNSRVDRPDHLFKLKKNGLVVHEVVVEDVLQWKSVEIPFDHEPIVLEHHARGWHFEYGLYHFEVSELDKVLRSDSEEVASESGGQSSPEQRSNETEGRQFLQPKIAMDNLVFEPLLNGTDLDGWDAPFGGVTHSVADGILSVKFDETIYGGIMTTREFENFHVRFEMRIDSSERGSNSNKHFVLRSQQSQSLASGWMFSMGGRTISGEEAALGDFNLVLGGAPGAGKSFKVPLDSSVSDVERDGIKSPRMSRDDWHLVEFIAAGPRIVMYVDGNWTSDVVDHLNRITKGRLTVRAQWYNQIDFRRIDIKEFADATEAEKYLSKFQSVAAANTTAFAERSHWKHSQGQFSAIGNGIWEERSANGKSYRYREINRNEEFVELDSVSGDTRIRIRLYANRAEYGYKPSLKFEKWFDGKWL